MCTLLLFLLPPPRSSRVSVVSINNYIGRDFTGRLREMTNGLLFLSLVSNLGSELSVAARKRTARWSNCILQFDYWSWLFFFPCFLYFSIAVAFTSAYMSLPLSFPFTPIFHPPIPSHPSLSLSSALHLPGPFLPSKSYQKGSCMSLSWISVKHTIPWTGTYCGMSYEGRGRGERC